MQELAQITDQLTVTTRFIFYINSRGDDDDDDDDDDDAGQSISSMISLTRCTSVETSLPHSLLLLCCTVMTGCIMKYKNIDPFMLKITA